MRDCPATVEGRNIYLCSPEYMAQYARRFLLAGVKIVGGCCGTTPEHIKEIRSEARSLQHVQRFAMRSRSKSKPHVQGVSRSPGRGQEPPWARNWRRESLSRSSRFCRRGAWTRPRKSRARSCAKPAGIDCINVPDGPRASARMSAQVTCQLIQQHAGIEAVLHFCCRDRNILSIQSELLGAYTVGVRNLICITGDPPRMGTYPDATAVFDVDAIGLTNIVNNLNHGLDLGGNPMGSQTALLLGVGANPGALNMDEELRRFDWKVKAGAEYVVTQPVFDLDLLEAFLKRTEHYKLPLIAGIWPLTSYRNAEFMVNELRVPVPEIYMERMRRAENAEAARAEGIAIAREMVERVQPMVAGRPVERAFRTVPNGDRSGRGHRSTRLKYTRYRRATDLIEIDSEQPGRPPLSEPPPSIRRGEVVAMPTDALYMLVADPSESARGGPRFRRQGPRNRPRAAAAGERSVMAEDLAKDISARFYLLARHFWPGPLTIIAPASAHACR